MSFEDRIRMAAECPDLQRLSPVKGAGEVSEYRGFKAQKLHFGGWVTADTYYGAWMTDLIQLCRGAHEPQEEVAFAQMLEHLPPQPVMLELGGYWCFYTIWLRQKFPDAIQFVVEPVSERRAVGETNLLLNDNPARILRAAVGAQPGILAEFRTGAELETDMPVVSVDSLSLEHSLSRIDVLHADIQGFELQMLRGAERMLTENRVSWIFISTHRWLEDAKKLDLHVACQDFLRQRGYIIVADHTPEESYSTDGLIVAKAPGVRGPSRIELSHRPAAVS